MGAGHCPWGGYSNRNVCNIDGEVRLTSRYRAMLRPGTFHKFGTLPATLGRSQYYQIVIVETPSCPTTSGKMPRIVGTMPKVPHLFSSVTVDPIPNLCERNWLRKGTFLWIIDLDL